MPEITCNEEINKSVEPEVVRIILELLARYNVPTDQQYRRFMNQKDLIRQLRAARKEANSNVR